MNWSIVQFIIQENKIELYPIPQNKSRYKNLVHDIKYSLVLIQVYNHYLKHPYGPAESMT
jgi:hypothetical protein